MPHPTAGGRPATRSRPPRAWRTGWWTVWWCGGAAANSARVTELGRYAGADQRIRMQPERYVVSERDALAAAGAPTSYAQAVAAAGPRPTGGHPGRGRTVSAFGFLRWHRQGSAAAIGVPRSTAGGRQRAVFTSVVTFTDQRGRQATATHDATLFGPGDVIGLDERQVIRMAPTPNALDAEWEQFAHVEFDDPSLPWLLSPFHEETADLPNGSPQRRVNGTLTPWVVLVVVREGHDNTFGYRPGALLPVLHVADPTQDLPDLAEADAWAHVQIAGGLPASAAAYRTLLERQPERTLSRLVCPRLLAARTSYRACVVPALEAGRRAGLGAELDGVPAATPAWDHQASDPVDLPVYLSWTFTTAADAGFETLVRRLAPRSADQLPGVGQRGLDLSHPGFGLPDAPGSTTPIGGALRVPGSAVAVAGLGAAIAPIVNRLDQVGPPLYGRWLAAVDRVPALVRGPSWVNELNLEPRHRIAAGLGVQTVRAEQEQLLAAAWDQLGEVLRANQLLRQAQLALQVGTRVRARHFAVLSGFEVLQLAGPALARISTTDGTRTVAGSLEQSCLPAIACHAGFRRLIRPRGRLARRAARPLDGRPLDVTGVLQELLTGDLTAPPTVPAGAAVVGTDERDAILDALRGQPRLRPVAGRLQQVSARAARPACVVPTENLADRVLDQLRPVNTVPPRTRAQIGLPPGVGPVADSLEPILAAPRIDTPTYRSLVERGQDWLLPGLQHVPPNTACGLEPDNAFVEAFLVGLNHEMGRELLWRGYPTDQRGTVLGPVLGPGPAGDDRPYGRSDHLDRPLAAELRARRPPAADHPRAGPGAAAPR